jgi:hypothetical protein
MVLRTDLDELAKSDVTKFARFATRRASIRYSNRASLNIGSVFAKAGNSVAYIIKLMSTLRGRYPLVHLLRLVVTSGLETLDIILHNG